MLNNGNLFKFYALNVLIIFVVPLATLYVEIYMLDIMSENLSIIPPPDFDDRFYIVPLIIRMLLYITTISITIISAHQKQQKDNLRIYNELKSEKLDMELRFLRSQITPHFLFNSLNNIYSLVYTKDENAPNSVLKLSDILRYVTVDCQVDLITLDKEIKFIDAFVDFYQMSMENKSNVVFEKHIENKSFMIPPMILQPLVENCFKHSRLLNDADGFVHLTITQEKDSLTFVARNSIKKTAVSIVDTNKKQHSGIGVANVKKRLDLYYADNYSFDIEQNENIYSLTMKIGDKKHEKKV